MDEETQTTPQAVEPTPAAQRRAAAGRAARIVGVLLTLLIAAGAVGWLQFVRIVPAQGRDAYVDVHPGDSVTAVSERVFALGMTSGPQALRWYWRIRRGGSLGEGRYVLSGIGTMEALYRQLGSGSPLTVRVTFPEGYTLRQMATRLEEQAGIAADEFLKAARDAKGSILEGRLFPDTYEFLYAGDAAEVVARMLGRFADVVPSDWASQAAGRSLTGDELVTVASIVEREARYDEDRPLVASVIFNRLSEGMLLQMDATLGYVLPSHDGFYTYEELKQDSPYNTYLHPGLPPTPICNPGLASLDAAAHAPASKYFYFLAKPDGHCVFAWTFAEHSRNMRLYLPGGN